MAVKDWVIDHESERPFPYIAAHGDYDGPEDPRIFAEATLEEAITSICDAEGCERQEAPSWCLSCSDWTEDAMETDALCCSCHERESRQKDLRQRALAEDFYEDRRSDERHEPSRRNP